MPKAFGGAWTGRVLGVGSDSHGGFARTKKCMNFCDMYYFPKQAVHTYTKFNGPENAKCLSHEYCRRGEFFYVKWLAENNLAYVFTQSDLDEYVESQAWIDFILQCDAGSEELNRALQIRVMAPRLG